MSIISVDDQSFVGGDPGDIFGFLHDLDAENDGSQAGSRFHFQFMFRQIENTHDAGMKAIAVPGHSHGIHQFGGGGEDAWPIKIDIIGDKDDPAWVADRVAWLKALTFPEYDDNDNLIRPPHTCLFVIGNWINERVKVHHFKATFGPVFDRLTRCPRQASVELLLKRFNEVAINYRQFRP
jgi:hypothetical protein